MNNGLIVRPTIKQILGGFIKKSALFSTSFIQNFFKNLEESKFTLNFLKNGNFFQNFSII